MTVVEQQLGRARRCQRSAALLLGDGDVAGAANRLYYALYHSACAALLDAGRPLPRTHSGLIAAFGEIWVRPGRVASDIGKLLNLAEHERMRADYTGEEPDHTQLRHLLARAETFLTAIEALVGGSP